MLAANFLTRQKTTKTWQKKHGTSGMHDNKMRCRVDSECAVYFVNIYNIYSSNIMKLIEQRDNFLNSVYAQDLVSIFKIIKVIRSQKKSFVPLLYKLHL